MFNWIIFIRNPKACAFYRVMLAFVKEYAIMYGNGHFSDDIGKCVLLSLDI